jgi:hypothetical protein
MACLKCLAQRLFVFLAALSWAFLADTAQISAAGDARFIQDRFAIGFWVDPPVDAQMDARYAEIAEANFTFTLGNYHATSPEGIRRQLECSEKHGLKAIAYGINIPAVQLPTNSACWGYLVADEPGFDSFAGLSNIVSAIRAARPGKLAFINMLPNYTPDWILRGKTYAQFIQQYLVEVKPDVLSMDHYPYFKPNVDGRESYCQTLEIMRSESLKAGIPFWNFFNTMPFGDHTDPTEAQLRWQIYTSLAYGAKGVMYFCYWTPSSPEFPKGGAIITRAGKRTRHYDEARRINAGIKNLGPTLMQMTNSGVLRIGASSPATNRLAGTGLQSISEGEYLIGVFRHSDGRRAVLIHNYQFAYSQWPTVEFDVDSQKVMEVSKTTGKESQVEDDSPDMPGLQLSFDAGEGRLFLLPQDSGGR